MKKVASILFLLVVSSAVTSRVFAQNGCGGQYQPSCPPAAILVDKKVGKPTGETKGGIATITYVDNLTTADYRFKPDQEIFFQITAKNTTDNQVTNVVLKDIVPASADPIEGLGVFDASSRVITINAGNFASQEEKNYLIKMAVFSKDKLPADKGLFCEVNKAQASGNGSGTDEDTSQFCIEKEVTGVSKVPSAGPEMGLLFIGGELTLLGIGLFFKMKK